MSCSCGGDDVEEHGSETFCTDCGTLVSNVPLVTAWSEYSGQLADENWNVANKYLKVGVFENCQETSISRVLKLRRSSILEECQKLNFVNVYLVSETANLVLESYLVKRKKHLLRKHIAAGIYTACKVNGIEISSSLLIENLDLQGKHIITFINNFYKNYTKSAVPRNPSVFHRYNLLAFKDMESNQVIPSGKAAIFHQYFTDLLDILLVTTLRSTLVLTPNRSAAVILEMILNFNESPSLSETQLYNFEVKTDDQIKKWKRLILKCWSRMIFAAVNALPWLFPHITAASRYHLYAKTPSRHFFRKRLDKILAHKDILIEFNKKRESSVWRGTTNRRFLEERYNSFNLAAIDSPANLGSDFNTVPVVQTEDNDMEIKTAASDTSSESCSSSSQADSSVNEFVNKKMRFTDKDMSSDSYTDDEVRPVSSTGTYTSAYPVANSSTESSPIDNNVMDECIEKLKQYISTNRYTDTITLFKRMLQILYFTELRSKFIKIPRLFYYVLLYQIVTAHELDIPPLGKLLKGGDKASKVDGLIRLTFIKVFMSHQHGLLPLKITREKLFATIHTFYGLIITNGMSYKKMLRQVQLYWEESQNDISKKSASTSPAASTTSAASSPARQLLQTPRYDANSQTFGCLTTKFVTCCPSNKQPTTSPQISVVPSVGESSSRNPFCKTLYSGTSLRIHGESDCNVVSDEGHEWSVRNSHTTVQPGPSTGLSSQGQTPSDSINYCSTYRGHIPSESSNSSWTNLGRNGTVHSDTLSQAACVIPHSWTIPHSGTESHVKWFPRRLPRF